MFRLMMTIAVTLTSVFLVVGCSSTTEDNRQPAGYSRAGRAYKEPRAMNHRRMDTDAIFNRCLRERSETYCRNRLGR